MFSASELASGEGAGLDAAVVGGMVLEGRNGNLRQ